MPTLTTYSSTVASADLPKSLRKWVSVSDSIMISYGIVVLASLSAAYAYPRSPEQGLSWGPCPAEMNFTSAYPYECATLNVPLDYTNEDNGKRLDLALLRVKALNQPAKGSILFNPGGPGATGTELVAAQAEEMQV